MSNIMKVNSSSMIAFSAKDAYGANFKVNIFDMKTNTVVIQDAPLIEGIEPIVAATTTIKGVQNKSAVNITVTDSTVFGVADRISISGDIYRIKSIDTTNNILELHKGLVNAIPDATAVDRVGNLSAFYVELYVTKLGFFLIQAKDTKFGLQYTESVDVRSVLLDDKLNHIDGNVDQVMEETKSNSGFRIII